MRSLDVEKARLRKEFQRTKKSLQTMSKNGNMHKLRTKRRVVKYGAIGFARNIWLSIASTIVMTMTLLILFVTVIASAILASTADSMREKIDITVYFRPGTSSTVLNSMANTMRNDHNVRSVEVHTSKEEYQSFLKDNEHDKTLMATLDDPSMRDLMIQTMQATMRIKVYNVDNLNSIEGIVSTDRDFLTNLDPDKLPTYDVKRAEINAVTSWANIARNGGIILSIVFSAVSMLVIFNTIRMAIFSRREEIYMMRLVGADKGFIRDPFIIEAQICGVISGIAAATLGCVGFSLISPGLRDYGINISAITNVLETQWSVAVYAIIIFAGIVLGTVSAGLAIRKYLTATPRKTTKRK